MLRQLKRLLLARHYDGFIRAILHLLLAHDKGTYNHSTRSTDVALRLARFIGNSRTDLMDIKRGSLLHDIGKIGVPTDIVQKPGALTADEWIEMRKHPVIAHEMLQHIPDLSHLTIPYGHHERWDGSGYPQGLSGFAIPRHARLFAIVDVWDAITSDRPYRQALPEQEAMQIITSLAGVHFDPDFVDAFIVLKALERYRRTS